MDTKSPPTSVPPTATAQSKGSALPFLRVSDESIFDEANRALDGISDVIREETAGMGHDVVVERSQPGQYPLFAQVEAWVPEGNAKDMFRIAYIRFSLQVNPYLEHSTVCTIDYQRMHRPMKRIELHDVGPNEARNWVRYVFGKGSAPEGSGYIERVLVPGLIKFFTLGFIDQTKNNLKETYKGERITPHVVLFAISIPFFFILFPWLVPLGLIPLGLGIWLVVRRPRRMIAPAVPHGEPRSIRLVDTWHASIPDLGPQALAISAQLKDNIGQHYKGTVKISEESYVYRGTREFVERSQLVFVLNQAIVYVHCYDIGGDLFVGWDASLNYARWGIAQSVGRAHKNGELWEMRMPGAVRYQPNEYDLVDVSALSETIHGRLKTILQQEMKIHSIEEEIDFTIIRGDRGQAIVHGETDRGARRPMFRIAKTEGP